MERLKLDVTMKTFILRSTYTVSTSFPPRPQ